jgi:RNA polymerase-associated protein
MAEAVVLQSATITLYSNPECPISHRIRLMAQEKDISLKIINVNSKDGSLDDLLDLNPYATTPTLVDRDLILYDPQVIIEYLDERYPHPPLMSVDPVIKARSRQMLRQIETEWYQLVNIVQTSQDEQEVKIARRDLQERLVQMTPVFDHQPYFLSNDYTLVDVSLAVLLWRLPYLGIELPKSAKAIRDYSEKVLSREGFGESLSDDELDMRDII